jgi:hypothetical protein
LLARLSITTPGRHLSQKGTEFMPGISSVKKHMEVISADGVHIGTVDRVEGNRIKLTTADAGEGHHRGHHHYVPAMLIAEVEGQKVRLSANAAVAVTFEQEKDGKFT